MPLVLHLLALRRRVFREQARPPLLDDLLGVSLTTAESSILVMAMNASFGSSCSISCNACVAESFFANLAKGLRKKSCTLGSK